MTIAEGDPRPSRTEKRWFGILLLIVFTVLGLVIGWQLRSVRAAEMLIGSGLTLAIVYYAVAPARVALYRSWMALTMPLGRAISTLLLAFIYFLVITPMFLFSGTFFPLDVLPGWAQKVAMCLPLTHVAILCRELALGRFSTALIVPMLVVIVLLVLAIAAALPLMHRRLIQ